MQLKQKQGKQTACIEFFFFFFFFFKYMEVQKQLYRVFAVTHNF